MDWNNLGALAISTLATGVFIYILAFIVQALKSLFNNDPQPEPKNFKIGYVDNEIYRVMKKGNSYPLFNLKNERVGTLGSSLKTRKSAYNEGFYIQAYINKSGKKIYRKTNKKISD